MYKGRKETDLRHRRRSLRTPARASRTSWSPVPAVSPIRMRFQDVVDHVFGQPHYNPYEDEWIEGWSFEQQRTFIQGVPHLRMVTEGEGCVQRLRCHVRDQRQFSIRRPQGM